MSTFEADPQVKPQMPHSQAILAAIDGFGKPSEPDVPAVPAEVHRILSVSATRNQHIARTRGF
jgi:hypothetical protein